MTDDDLRTLVREFRTSVSDDLAEQHRRFDAFSDENRQHLAEVYDRISGLERRLAIAETSIMNEIRALSNRFDLRLGRMENRLNELGT